MMVKFDGCLRGDVLVELRFAHALDAQLKAAAHVALALDTHIVTSGGWYALPEVDSK